MQVFITVGTTQFDQLISAVQTDSVLSKLKLLNCRKLVIQIGSGCEIPNETIEKAKQSYGIDVDYYRYKPEIQDDIRSSDLVISHAGAGSCIEVLNAGKKLVVVVNDTLMHNHQTELAEQLSADGYLLQCTTETLPETLGRLTENTMLRSYEKGNVQKLVDFVDKIMCYE